MVNEGYNKDDDSEDSVIFLYLSTVGDTGRGGYWNSVFPDKKADLMKQVWKEERWKDIL